MPGSRFNAIALQIHEQPLSPYYLYELQTANGDEADDATRPWELWYDQSFDRKAFDIKIGQQSLDQEFITGKYSGLVRQYDGRLAAGADLRPLRRRSSRSVPLNGTETLIELTNQAQLTPWLQLQPDAQFVFDREAASST